MSGPTVRLGLACFAAWSCRWSLYATLETPFLPKIRGLTFVDRLIASYALIQLALCAFVHVPRAGHTVIEYFWLVHVQFSGRMPGSGQLDRPVGGLARDRVCEEGFDAR